MLKAIPFLLFLLIFSPARAGVIQQHIQDAKVVGSGVLRYLLWNIYHATLYAPSGKWRRDRPFALSLRYLRATSKNKIADVSVKEIRKLGFTNEIKLAAWHTQMKKIFPDVKKGTTLIGIYIPGKPTRFYKGNSEIGVIQDPEFGIWFFNIWLAKETSEPKLREKLLGHQ